MNCATCRWRHPAITDDDDRVVVPPHCRRHAPQLLSVVMSAQPDLAITPLGRLPVPKIETHFASKWPAVADDMWCGDYQAEHKD